MFNLQIEIQENTFYCKKCINHKGCISVEIGSDGICNHCKEPDKYFVVPISPELKEQKRKEMEKILKKIKAKHRNREYDCVVGFSGGKDSTYLLYILAVKYGLNVLAVSVNSGYMNKVALNNIKQTIKNLGVEHIFIKPPIEVFTKLYRWHIINYDSNDLPMMKKICDNCTDLIDSLVIKEAARRGIPYVFIGLSPDENARHFFEIPKEKLNHSLLPEHWKSDFYSNEDRKWWWDPNEFGSKKKPRLLFPLHIWPYNEKKVIATVERAGLVRRGKADPLKTNCILIWAIGMYDIIRFGHHMYRLQIAKLIRQGVGDREHWLEVFNRLEPLVANGEFNTQQIDRFFKQIGITRDELIELARFKRKNDPRRDNIENAMKLKGISL